VKGAAYELANGTITAAAKVNAATVTTTTTNAAVATAAKLQCSQDLTQERIFQGESTIRGS
jgi:hypothetical protein